MSIEKKIGKFIKLNISSLSSSLPTNEQKPTSSKSESTSSLPLPDEIIREKQLEKEREKEYINELYLKKERTIIKALQVFNENNTECNKKIFVKRIPDYSKSNSQNERELYAAIDRIIKKSFLKQQYFSVTEPLSSPLSINDIDINNTHHICKSNNDSNNNSEKKIATNANNKNSYMNVDKLIFKLKIQNKTLEFIAIKGIIISLINVINERIGKLFLVNFSGDTPDIDCGIFHEIYNEFLILSNICPLLEQDFSQSLACFKEKYEMNFSLCELFSDLFWDYIFKIKEINYLFVNFFALSEGQDLDRIVIKEILKVIWLIELPLKKNIGEILEISAITNEKIFFAAYIIDYKTQLLYPNKIIQFQVNISNENNNNNGKAQDNDNDNDIDDITYDNIIKLKEDSLKEAHIKELISENISQHQDLQQIEKLKQLQQLQQQLQEQQFQLQQQKELQKKLKQQHYQQQLLQHIESQQKQQQILPKAINSTALILQSEDTPCDLSQPLCIPQLVPKKHSVLIQKQQDFELEQEQDQEQDIKQDKKTHTKTNNKKKKNNQNQIKTQTSKESVIQNIDDVYKSIEELYNYIVTDHSNTKKRNKKKSKRNRPNTTDNNNIRATSNSNKSHENNTEENNISFNNRACISNTNNSHHNSNNNCNSNHDLDSIVEQFKIDLWINDSKASDVQKIKPNISSEWLKSIKIN